MIHRDTLLGGTPLHAEQFPIRTHQMNFVVAPDGGQGGASRGTQDNSGMDGLVLQRGDFGFFKVNVVVVLVHKARRVAAVSGDIVFFVSGIVRQHNRVELHRAVLVEPGHVLFAHLAANDPAIGVRPRQRVTVNIGIQADR